MYGIGDYEFPLLCCGRFQRRPRIKLAGRYAGPNRSLLFAGRSEGYRSVTRAAATYGGHKSYP